MNKLWSQGLISTGGTCRGGGFGWFATLWFSFINWAKRAKFFRGSPRPIYKTPTFDPKTWNSSSTRIMWRLYTHGWLIFYDAFVQIYSQTENTWDIVGKLTETPYFFSPEHVLHHHRVFQPPWTKTPGLLLPRYCRRMVRGVGYVFFNDCCADTAGWEKRCVGRIVCFPVGWLLLGSWKITIKNIPDAQRMV